MFRIAGVFTFSSLILLAGVPSLAAPLDFERDVYAVLQRACFECHGPKKQESNLRLDEANELFASGVVVAGKPDQSELIRRITLPRNHDEVMPVIGEPLSKKHVRRLRQWIADGAVWPKSFTPPSHWAYVPPVRAPLPQPPAVYRDWPRQPLDYFALKRMLEEGLKPSPEASPEALIRRVYLDLIGLPPSPAEVERFVDDPSDQAYSKLVDDLLERPQFGERWARPWLDLARYADSHGFQRDNLRDIWAYRDWVISALNRDMPFDQFTIEQIAGDLLPEATQSQRIATGFHRCTPTNVEAGSLPEETRTEAVVDRVNTTAAVWLGTTLECAQCHDHKYDPFTMKDYYRLLAFFNSTELEADRANPKAPSSIKFIGPSMPIANEADSRRRAELEQEIAEHRQQQTVRREQLKSDLKTWAGEMAEAAAQAPQQHVLQIVDFQSEGNTDTHRILEDGSVLLVGDDPPPTDIYTIRVRVPHENVSALRIDALTDDSLPGKGPGRGDPVRRNFILSEFSATLGDRPLKFTRATADFSQNKWNVSQAIDGNPKTGWAIAPKFGEPHWATFVLSEPLANEPGDELVLVLSQQYGSARTIGRVKVSAITGDTSAAALPKALVKTFQKPSDQWNAADKKRLLDHRVTTDPQSNQLEQEIKALQKQLDAIKPDTTLVMVELDKPRATHIFQRGDYRTPGEKVEPGTPEILPPLPEGPANRTTLARWLVDRENPLTARVTVNRWWAELFGRGIVPTLEDFGIKGEPPSHPDLLDYLAVDFMEHGWSMKHTLRSIVLSTTYRQSGHATPAALEIDDQNQWLARGPQFRMDAEMIRDNALAIAGLLSLKQFGPPIRPYQPAGIWSKVGGTAYKYEVSPGDERHRRGIYVVIKRGAPYPSFVNFDGTARLACVVKRSRTNTPLQALTLLNDPVYVEAAKGLATRMAENKATAEGIAFGFQLCTSRRPTKDEAAVLADLFEQEAKQIPLEQAKVISADAQVPDGVTEKQFAGWYAVATTLLNMHETITKP